MPYRKIALILLLFFPLQAAANELLVLQGSEGDLHARFTMTSTTLLVDEEGNPHLTAADQLLCTLTVRAPEEKEISLPTFSGPNFGDFTLLDQGPTKTRRTDQGLEHERQWLIEPYNPGPYQLPEILIKASHGSMTTELVLPRPELVVHKIEGDENLGDILPPRLPETQISTFLLMAGGAVVILALIIWAGMRLKNKAPKPVPPQKRALEEIDQLTGHPPRATIDGLAHTLRCYLDSRFELHCCEQTYDEYAPSVEGCKEIPQESRAVFLDILKRCDLIKFSNIEPEPDEVETMTAQTKKALAACPMAEPDDKVCGRW